MSNRKAPLLLAHVRTHRPDSLVTLERDAWWVAKLDERAGDGPHAIKCPLGKRDGMHLYSRLPIEHAAVRSLADDDNPSIHAQVRRPGEGRVVVHFFVRWLLDPLFHSRHITLIGMRRPANSGSDRFPSPCGWPTRSRRTPNSPPRGRCR